MEKRVCLSLLLLAATVAKPVPHRYELKVSF